MFLSNELLIRINKDKLNELIMNNAPHAKILKQSQKLDKYIYRQMLIINQ